MGCGSDDGDDAAVDPELSASEPAGAVGGEVGGRVVLRALGGICGMRAQGWEDDAERIALLLYDGLRYGAVTSQLGHVS